MFFKQFLVSLAVSVLVWLCYYWITKAKNRELGYWQPFLIILAGTWAGGIWLTPLGPELSGFHIIPYLSTGFFVGALFVLISNRKPPKGRRETLEKLEAMSRQKDWGKAAYFALNFIMWFILALFCAAIITRYLRVR